MSLIQRIKSVLGLNGSTPREEDRPVAVTVEHDPEPTTDERAVEEPAATDDLADEAPTTDEGLETDDAPDGEWTHDGDVIEITGIGPSYSERLQDAGVHSVGDLAGADAARLAEDTDLSEKRIAGWIDAAQEMASGD